VVFDFDEGNRISRIPKSARRCTMFEEITENIDAIMVQLDDLRGHL
jgi:hypothetical protein